MNFEGRRDGDFCGVLAIEDNEESVSDSGCVDCLDVGHRDGLSAVG